MPEVPVRTVFPATHDTDTLLQKRSKVLIRATLIFMPLLLNESLQLRKGLFNRIEIWEIGRQIQQLDAGITAHLFDSLTVTKRGIVHDENRVPLWVWLQW